MTSETPVSVQNEQLVTDDATYRWYKCTQKMPARWSCELLKTPITLETIKNDYSTMNIPICKYIPSVLDNMIIQRKLNKVELLPYIKKI